ncbi:MAG TPA: 3D domain-containing protein [Pyrinomonadaceae bacterium]|nr:3D domain-containing protein [Pyrinomonadaceae bacterium]
MKKLVRGGAVLLVLSMCVVFIYANVPAESTLVIANDSQTTIENTISDNLESILIEPQTDDTNKKLVKTTGSVRASGMGASRGAFSATAYCLSGKTALGHGVRRGIIAADPRVLKLGSKITIDAGPWSGTYLVSDTGGAIKGKKLDIWVPNCSEARKFGRRSVQVFSTQ